MFAVAAGGRRRGAVASALGPQRRFQERERTLQAPSEVETERHDPAVSSPEEEAFAGGEDSIAHVERERAERPSPPSGVPPATAAAGAALGASPAPAIEPTERPAPQAGIGNVPLDLERIRELWPAVSDAIREQNGMVAALLHDAVPGTLDDDHLTVHFPEDAAFSKKKAEANRQLLIDAVRSVTGSPVTIAFELNGTRQEHGSATLGPDELAERLKREFGAEEIFEDRAPETQD